MEWSNETVLNFIDDYRANPSLWDTKVSDYKNTVLKKAIMVALAKKYDCDVGQIKRKIKSLRTAFRREVTKVRKRCSEGTETQPTWYAYRPLSFLLDDESLKFEVDGEADDDLELEDPNECQETKYNIVDDSVQHQPKAVQIFQANCIESNTAIPKNVFESIICSNQQQDGQNLQQHQQQQQSQQQQQQQHQQQIQQQIYQQQLQHQQQLEQHQIHQQLQQQHNQQQHNQQEQQTHHQSNQQQHQQYHPPQHHQQQQQQQQQQQHHNQQQSNQQHQHLNHQPNPIKNTIPKRSKLKRPLEHTTVRQSSVQRSVMDACKLFRPSAKIPDAGKDEFDFFGKNISARIRKLRTFKARSCVQHLISNIIFEAEMGKYDDGLNTNINSNTSNSNDMASGYESQDLRPEEPFIKLEI